jgi:hypothetical protein
MPNRIKSPHNVMKGSKYSTVKFGNRQYGFRQNKNRCNTFYITKQAAAWIHRILKCITTIFILSEAILSVSELHSTIFAAFHGKTSPFFHIVGI